MMGHFGEMEEKGMIRRGSDGVVSITPKGRKFVEQYSELINLIESVGL
jgi:predicted transcriptional regulator